METDDEDPQLKLERDIDNLFERSDAMVFFIFNQIMEIVNERDTTPKDA